MAKIKSNKVFTGDTVFISEPQSVVLRCNVLDKQRPQTSVVVATAIYNNGTIGPLELVSHDKAFLINIEGTSTKVRVPSILFHGGYTRIFKTEVEAKAYSDGYKVNDNMESFFDMLPVAELIREEDFPNPPIEDLLDGLLTTSIKRSDIPLQSAITKLIHRRRNLTEV